VLAGGPVGEAVGGAVEGVTGAVEDTAEALAPALPPLTEVLTTPVAPGPDEVCVDANRQPVALVWLPLVGDALCPVGAFLMPKP
jgi:hypothetical protein